MAYTTIDKPSDYFNTLTWTGADTSAGRDFIGVGFQPDLVWVKTRSVSNGHKWFDSVRGVGKSIQSENSGAETTNDGNGYIDSFDSDGFSSIAGSTNNYNFNNTSTTIVAWNWKAGTSFTNDASATGIGSIDSTGSVNDTAGFSIVSYTGTGSNGTIKHGLNTAPSCIITKSASAAEDWGMYHVGIGNTSNISLNLNNAQYSANSAFWNNTNPTSSVFTVGTHPTINYNTKTMIAYCFAEKKGYSKFGSYTGNGNADGTFVYTGFKPAWVMIKKTTGTNGWWGIQDNKRDPENIVDKTLYANVSDTEYSGANYYQDFLSNGFKIRTAHAGMNESAAPYIYMAFAENPFVTSTGVPATAR